MRRLLLIVAVVAALFTSACGLYDPTAGLRSNKTRVEQQIDALRTDHAKQIDALRREQEAKIQQLLAAKDAQLMGAANAFYGQDWVFQGLSPSLRNQRTNLVWHNLTLEGWKATGELMPDYATMKRIQDRLQKDLDEKITSLEQLQATHQQALAENQALVDTTRQFQEQLAAIAAKQREAEAVYRTALDAKQGELNDLNGRLIAAEKARSDDAKARQAQLAKLSWGAGILAALCLAGAIWSPVFKQQLGIAAVILGGAAVAIPFIEGWMILAGVGTAGVALVAWALLNHRKEERVADALVLAAQDVKEKAGDAWNHLKPAIEDRLARYRKTRGGKLVAERDVSIERHIDEKLAAYDALPAKTT